MLPGILILNREYSQQIAGCVSERENQKRVNSFPMKDLNSSRMSASNMDRNMDAPVR